MGGLKCEGCGRKINLLADGAIAYWCRDCNKLFPVEVKKRKRRKKKDRPVKLDVPILKEASTIEGVI